jgi:sugar phosphate isomerase/epimerase
MLDNVELLASYWTISAGLPHTDLEHSPFDFEDRVQSAARAGFKGFGIWHSDLEHVLRTRTLKEMKQILDNNGIKHVELEFLLGWFTDGEAKKKSDAQKRMLLTAAEELGARHVKVGDFNRTQAPVERMIEAFAMLCGEAAQHGTRIAFEVMPFAIIDSLPTALELVKGAGAPNGGICLDLWHMAKLGIPYSQVAELPAEYVTSVELNDGTSHCSWSLHEDTINHRRLCGEGEFDIKGFIEAVKKTGYNGPWGIEVLSQELRQLPLDELTSRAFNTTIAQFQS